MNASDALRWQQKLPDILCEQLGNQAGRIAADLWIGKYADASGPAVIAFMREVAEEIQLDSAQRQALRNAVHRARTGLVAEQALESPEYRAARKVARSLLQAMRQQVLKGKKAPPGEFISCLGRELSKKQGLQEMAAPALGWMVQGGKMPLLSVDQLQYFIHAVYVCLCQTTGPVNADAILQRAGQTASRLPEAGIFPPARLLYPDD